MKGNKFNIPIYSHDYLYKIDTNNSISHYKVGFKKGIYKSRYINHILYGIDIEIKYNGKK
jgi:hypothetical protein